MPRKNIYRVAAALSGIVIATVIWLLQPAALSGIEQHFDDYLVRTYPARPEPGAIAIIEIDQQSVDEFGPFPWPRERIARLLEAIAIGNPAAVFTDIWFLGSREGDEPLSRAISKLGERKVLAVNLDAYRGNTAIEVLGLNQVEIQPPAGAPYIARVQAPNYELIDNKTRLGMISVTPSADGLIRKLPCAARAANGSLFCASLEAAFAAKSIHDNAGAAQMIGGLQKDGTLELYFPGQWSKSPWIDSHFSAATVLEALDSETGATDLRESLEGKVVLIGWVIGGVGDVYRTPVDDITPGVWLHAVAVNQFLTGQFIKRLPIGYAVAVLLAVALLFGAILNGGNFLAWGILSLLEIGTIFGGAFFSFKTGHLMLPVVLSVFAVLLQISGIGFFAAFLTAYERSRVSLALARFMTPDMMKYMLENRQLLEPGMEKRRLTIMFTDIKEFTTLSNSYEPEVVMAMLNEYLEAMTKIIFKHHGTIDKIMGDGILAVFGAPRPQEDHAMRAIAAGIEMQRIINKELCQKWKDAGLGDLQIRVGINSDEVFVGNLGSVDHIEYTVIGRGVNLAQRLEANAPAGGILIGQNTFDLVGDKLVCEPVKVQAKGFDEEVSAYLFKGIKPVRM